LRKHGEEHLEMLLLRHADHVDQPGRFLVAQALAGGGQVGGGIEKTAVRFANQERQRVTALALELFEEYTFRTITGGHQTGGRQVCDHRGELIVIRTFPTIDQLANPQSGIDRVAMPERLGAKRPPDGQRFGITRLQAHHRLPGLVGKRRIAVEMLLGLAVETLQVGDVQPVEVGEGLRLSRSQVGQRACRTACPSRPRG
jgi:hypothetical protein